MLEVFLRRSVLMACCVADVLRESVEADLQLIDLNRWMSGVVPIQLAVLVSIHRFAMFCELPHPARV